MPGKVPFAHSRLKHLLILGPQYIKEETQTTTPAGKEARATRLITERASRRIGQMAFEIALNRPNVRTFFVQKVRARLLLYRPTFYRRPVSTPNLPFSMHESTSSFPTTSVALSPSLRDRSSAHRAHAEYLGSSSRCPCSNDNSDT